MVMSEWFHYTGTAAAGAAPGCLRSLLLPSQCPSRTPPHSGAASSTSALRRRSLLPCPPVPPGHGSGVNRRQTWR